MAKFTTNSNYKKLSSDEAIDFLEKYGTPEEKAEFKKACTSINAKTGKEVFNWLKGKKYFCEKYAPELLPVAKEKKSARMMNW